MKVVTSRWRVPPTLPPRAAPLQMTDALLCTTPPKVPREFAAGEEKKNQNLQGPAVFLKSTLKMEMCIFTLYIFVHIVRGQPFFFFFFGTGLYWGRVCTSRTFFPSQVVLSVLVVEGAAQLQVQWPLLVAGGAAHHPLLDLRS
ncbi:hypothetical protein mRhiFer1_008267 [Rhinolophus ferrumequinum]|uniref:Uncharacterized protein n=1 Tax=Rhinolophus ferrumequinum TaxID=59479 RepID=A0A7J7VRD8_RHIFE|nr:hypothetical protein mRhiFer1_008267 [Rhinolophus ferrumequinum]